MRKALVIFLLAVLPFQFAWGAAAGYCQHEQDGGISHFGHHVHKHQTKANEPAEVPGDADSGNGLDADCLMCHLCFAVPVAAVPDSAENERASQAAQSAQSGYARLLVAAIYRPNWPSSWT